MAQQISKLSDVISSTGLSSSSIYRLAGEGKFPKPIKLLSRSSGWIKSEVDEWIDDKIKASRTEPTEV